MKYINDITITEAVIHVLDKNSKEPLLNDFSLELDESTYEYLYKIFTKCLSDEKLVYAKFLNAEADPEVEVLAENYFKNKQSLLDVSKELTNRLFEITSANTNISSSDLLIASILTDQGPILAVVKMDYEDKNFKHSIYVEDEKTMISLIKDRESLPKNAGKVQKAAFIFPKESDTFDLMILDKKPVSDDNGTNYFANTFLKAQYVSNERDLTRHFISAMENWIAKNYACLPVKAEDIRSVVRRTYTMEDTIDVKELAEELFGYDEEYDEFIEYCKARSLFPTILIDRTWVDKTKPKVNLVLEKDIRLSLSSEVYSNPNRFEISANSDGSINFTVKNVMNYSER